MNNKIRQFAIAALSVWGIFSPCSIFAQQTIADYNLLDNGGEWTSDHFKNETIKFINDKDESTFALVETFVGEASLTFNSKVPVVLNGFLLLPGDDEKEDPRSFRLYGSKDGETWVILSSVLGADFGDRNAPLLTTVANNDAYNYVRLAVTANRGGEQLKIAEFQLLGYPQPLYDGILTSENGVLTSEYPEINSESLGNVMDDNFSASYKLTNIKNCWLEYELNEPQEVTGYSLVSSTSNSYENNLRSWELLGSADGENWTYLDVRSNKDFFQVTNNMQVFQFGEERKLFDWGVYADKSHQSMEDYFWTSYGSGYYLRHGWHPNTSLQNQGYNYWWMAHALDVFVDAYARTGEEIYRTKMNQLYNGVLSYGQRTYGRNDLWNGFFDDMEWMGLACLRANEVSGNTPRWREAAIQLWDWIKEGWNDHHGGGIQWVDSQPESKNACSNAPAIILAARIYNLTQEKQYLEWAEKIFDWMEEALIFPENGLVKDGYGNDELSWTLTYNQGTWIGACLELYKITHEQKYYDLAMRTADYVLTDRSKFSPYGILYNNEGGGDGGLFKGIFMRYLSQWILSGELDAVRENYFVEYMYENGKSLWEAATLKPDMMFGNSWLTRPERKSASEEKGSAYDASIHLSAVMMFELLDELERNGYIPEYKYNKFSTEQPYKYFRLQATSEGNNLEFIRWQLYTNTITPPVNIENSTMNEPIVRVENLNQGVILFNPDNFSLSYKIYDLSGRVVNSGEFSEEVKEIRLLSGNYIIIVGNQTDTHRQKIVIY